MKKLHRLMSCLRMRGRTLIALLIFAMLPAMSASAQNGKITLNVEGATLESVLEKIEQQTDYRFFYSRNVIDVNMPVSIKATDMALPQALDKLFAGRGISYVIDKKQVVLSKTQAAEAAPVRLVAVRGNVRGDDGEPLIGVSVTATGVQGGATTDVNGDYVIHVPEGATLTFSYVGCTPISRKAGKDGKVDVTLNDDNNVLNEVVVVGYGVQKKRLVTGATLNIKGDDIQRQNTTNAIGALYSSVPGVNIVQNNGQPDAGFKVNIRGLGTTGSSSPLYVIDGIAGADINSLNPADIESVDILKDAASCAIYGSRAANGVVLVTTRQGNKGKVNVSYDGYYSIQRANLNGVKSVSAQEYIDLINRAFVSKGTISEGESIHDWSALMPKHYGLIQSGAWRGTDWLEEFVNNNAPSYNNAVSVDGGNDLARFSLGFTNTSTEGTLGVPKPPKYNRTTVRLNTDFTLWRRGDLEIVKIGENVTFSTYKSNSISQGNIYDNKLHNLLVLSPLHPAYNDDGSFYTYADQQADGMQLPSGGYNMLEDNSLRSYDNRRFRIQANFWLEVNPHKDWRFRSVYGYNYYNRNNRTYTPAYELSSKDYSEYDRVQQEASTNTFWTWENTLQWGHDFGEHHVDALIGTSMEQQGWGQSVGAWRKDTKFGTWEAANISNSDSAIDPEMVSVWGGNTVPFKKLISFFGRVNYNFMEKYLFTFILRHDGSSNFARGHRFGTFPSVSAGWIMTNEKWMESSRSWIDFLKIRGSWGRNGNCAIDNFQYLATVSLNAPYDFTTGGTSISTGAYPDIIPNPDLTWEKSEQLDFGFDARFLNQRLVATFDWYRKTTRDWLVNAPTLDSYGTGSPVI
ncbi:MAG: SusC/RagA family TonB-linked outer membrane protein, partial [Muribaculaceae bacterium]|nr:SusC/RagA family TonB-linked outer membrane protein [Muribaculaceae bacterium]